MIPLILRLQDFMSYATLDLDFRGIHSAVLSGPNGAGKSTLLDAMTYALWDRARSGADDLIRLGQPEMWAELTFDMDGFTYRVMRRRTRKKGVQSQLSFQQLGEGDFYVSLDGNTLRETQGRINEVLKMGYETFVNSAFILQGRADQFTTKTPRERKALLGDILGLQHYDDLATRARERWKAAQSHADHLESEQTELRSLLGEKAETAAALERAKEGAGSLVRLLELAQDRQARLLGEQDGLDAARRELDTASAARQLALDEQARFEAEAVAHAAGMEAARADVARSADIEADFAAFTALSEVDRQHRAKAEAAHAVDRRLAQAREAANNGRHAHALALQGLEAELASLERDRLTHRDVVAQKDTITQARAEHAAAVQAVATHMEVGQRRRQVEERLAVANQAVQRATLAHEAAARDRDARLARALAACAQQASVAEAVEKTQAELKTLANAAVEQDRVKEKGFAFKAARERAEAAIETAHGVQQALTAKLAQLDADLAVHAGGRRGAATHHACPLCQTELEGKQIEAIMAQYRRDIQAQEDEAARHAHAAAAAEQERLACGVRYKELARELQAREAAQQKLGELRQQLTSLDAARAEADLLAAEKAADQGPVIPAPVLAERDAATAELEAFGHDPSALAVLQARVAELRWAESRGWQLEQALAALAKLDARLPELQAELESRRAQAAQEADAAALTLQTLEAELAAVGHDAASMADVQGKLKALGDAPARHAKLQQRLLWLEGAAAALARLEVDAAQQARRAAELMVAIADWQRKLERRPAWESELEGARAEVERLNLESARRHAELGRLESELARLEALELRLAEQRAAWQAAIDEAQTFKELTDAFGKNGIQALIIENALPELEEEANHLLARITDNRMHVRLATQKEKKSGGAAETLEIYISDEVGTRNYEMYSGGEAFRVNFALRLALSRLLARRAGARLRTLVIDEGFGTQDEKGRERLVEAINAVSGEFERILVITHVRELKDAFNTHIEVSKRGGVSEVKLSA